MFQARAIVVWTSYRLGISFAEIFNFKIEGDEENERYLKHI